MSAEILIRPEVTQVPSVAVKADYSIVLTSLLPPFKAGGQLRFKRADLDQWIEDQKAASRDGDSK